MSPNFIRQQLQIVQESVQVYQGWLIEEHHIDAYDENSETIHPNPEHVEILEDCLNLACYLVEPLILAIQQNHNPSPLGDLEG